MRKESNLFNLPQFDGNKIILDQSDQKGYTFCKFSILCKTVYIEEEKIQEKLP